MIQPWLSYVGVLYSILSSESEWQKAPLVITLCLSWMIILSPIPSDTDLNVSGMWWLGGAKWLQSLLSWNLESRVLVLWSLLLLLLLFSWRLTWTDFSQFISSHCIVTCGKEQRGVIEEVKKFYFSRVDRKRIVIIGYIEWWLYTSLSLLDKETKTCLIILGNFRTSAVEALFSIFPLNMWFINRRDTLSFLKWIFGLECFLLYGI